MIREMKKEDTQAVIEMMQVFYASAAVETNGSAEIFANDVANCVGDSPYLEGYVFEEGDKLQGYAMIAKSFSTEFGKPCIWIEDIYIKEPYRGKGIGSAFFQMLEQTYTAVVFRLEVEKENAAAVHTYQKNGFQFLSYDEMIKGI